MNRGFITIATGSVHYYKLAANLLQSYRLFTAQPYPFAIIAEEENQYTDQFDEVIITNESTHSFLDKFLLLKLCPYDETIFFDADCLAYGDLNHFWEIFTNATDFSSIGVNVPRDSNKGAWYNIEDIGEYGKDLTYKVRVHAGICFIRHSEKLRSMYYDCIELYHHYNELTFHTCQESKDECILGIAMPMHNMKAVDSGNYLVTYPSSTYLNPNILYGKLQYKTPWQDYVDNGLLLHWGTAQTYLPLYQFETSCLHFMIQHKEKKLNILCQLLYRKRLLYKCLVIRFFFLRLMNRIKRVVMSPHH